MIDTFYGPRLNTRWRVGLGAMPKPTGAVDELVRVMALLSDRFEDGGSVSAFSDEEKAEMAKQLLLMVTPEQDRPMVQGLPLETVARRGATLINVFRFSVTHHWRPYDGRVLMFAAADEPAHEGETGALGWQDVCSDIAAIRLPGTHVTVMNNLQEIADRIELEVERLEGGQPIATSRQAPLMASADT